MPLREYNVFTKAMQARFPKLLRTWPDTPYNDWGLETPRGWNDLMTRMFEELEQVLAPHHDAQDCFQLAQAKSKFACLRVYTDRVPAAVSEQVRAIITKYEGLCDKACEHTGKPAKTYISKSSGWCCLLAPEIAEHDPDLKPLNQEDGQ